MKPIKIHKLEIRIDPAWQEAVANRCFEAGLRGLEVAQEAPVCRLVVYCDSPASTKTYAELIRQYLGNMRSLWPGSAPYRVTTTPMKETNWAETWKEYFKPTLVAPDMVVRPSWESYSPKEKETVIVIDPKMAFGTGTHETTSLALEAVHRLFDEREVGADTRLLDVGCGTGILAIAASLLGMPLAVGIDNDPVAVDCAAENAILNKAERRTFFVRAEPPDLTGYFDFIIANITSDALALMASDLRRLLAPDGVIYLTGILSAQRSRVEASYREMGMVLADAREKGEWILLEFETEDV